MICFRILMFAIAKVPERSERAYQEAGSCTVWPNTPQSFGHAKVVLNRKNFSSPSSGDLLFWTWRGKDPLSQPALHIDMREHAWLGDAGWDPASSRPAEGAFKLWTIIWWNIGPIKISHLSPCWVIWFPLIRFISNKGFNEFSLKYWDCRFHTVGMAHAWVAKKSGGLPKYTLALLDIQSLGENRPSCQWESCFVHQRADLSLEFQASEGVYVFSLCRLEEGDWNTGLNRLETWPLLVGQISLFFLHQPMKCVFFNFLQFN